MFFEWMYERALSNCFMIKDIVFYDFFLHLCSISTTAPPLQYYITTYYLLSPMKTSYTTMIEG